LDAPLIDQENQNPNLLNRQDSLDDEAIADAISDLSLEIVDEKEITEIN